MAYQKVFRRYELKYMITEAQKEKILEVMKDRMEKDEYGESTIRNIYFDSDDFILARHSIAKPDFKEKLRIRSYSRVTGSGTVFVELKRKYDHVVYKRRVTLTERDAMDWTCRGIRPRASGGAGHGQMTDEIEYFLRYYGNLRPAAFISYDREAYRMRKGAPGKTGDPEFRVTFDRNILFRDTGLSLTEEASGKPLLAPGMILMEVKCHGGMPLWMSEILAAEKIYRTSFSKYGRAYTGFILPQVIAEQASHHASQESIITIAGRRTAPAPKKTGKKEKRHEERPGYPAGGFPNACAHGSGI